MLCFLVFPTPDGRLVFSGSLLSLRFWSLEGGHQTSHTAMQGPSFLLGEEQRKPWTSPPPAHGRGACDSWLSIHQVLPVLSALWLRLIFVHFGILMALLEFISLFIGISEIGTCRARGKEGLRCG